MVTRETVTTGSSYTHSPRGVQEERRRSGAIESHHLRIITIGNLGKDWVMRCPNLPGSIAILVMAVTGASACSSDSGPNLPTGEGVGLLEIASGLSIPLYLTAPAGD